MPQEIIMPKLGLNMKQGTITKWLKKEGDQVKIGEPVAEIQTDKISAEVESTVDGYILKILAQEGEEKEITAPICIVGEKAEGLKEGALAGTRIFITPIARRLAGEKRLDYSAIKGTGPAGRIVKADILKVLSGHNVEAAAVPESSRIKISPLAKKMAEDKGIDFEKLKGSGPDGRIVKEDILKAVEEKDREAVKADRSLYEALVPATGDRKAALSGMRRVIAKRLSQSKHDIPHVYFKSTVDMSKLMELREKVMEAIKGKTGRKVSINDFILKAVSAALEDYPDVNVSLIDDEIIYHGSINVGMAVSIEKGLVVPVVKDASRKAISDICMNTANLAEKARSGKLMPDDMSGGTFTVSNLGMYGIDEFCAIINPPESAILAVGAIRKAPYVQDNQLVVRPLMELTLSVDHRVIDGALAAQFLKKIKDLLEDPYILLI